MSSSTTSSAPARPCVKASSAGSPASRELGNCTPFTTRHASTSKQAIMRLVSTGLEAHKSCVEVEGRPRPIFRGETAHQKDCPAPRLRKNLHHIHSRQR